MAGCWYGGESNSRSRPSQRQQKREIKKKSKLILEGQSILSVTEQGTWNVKEQFKLDKNKSVQEYWGNKLTNKCDNVIRFVSKNIQGLGLQPGNPKEDELKTWIANKNIDVIGVQETNVNWGKCRNQDRFSERIRNPSWEFARYSVAYNKRSNKYKHQYGGCISLAIDQVTHRISGSGADERGLGRWSWILMKGKDSIKVRVITIYQPNKTSGVNNSGSVYSQQRQYFLEQGIDKYPLEIFKDD